MFIVQSHTYSGQCPHCINGWPALRWRKLVLGFISVTFHLSEFNTELYTRILVHLSKQNIMNPGAGPSTIVK